MHRYASLLQQPIFLALQARWYDTTIAFIQVEAPSHIGRCLKQLVRHHFGDDKITSLQFRKTRPPRFPDFYPCGYWLSTNAEM